MSTLLVVEHEPGCPLDRFERLARRARGPAWSVRTRVRTFHRRRRDGLLVLGGSMSAYDDEMRAMAPATRQLLSPSASTGVPTLGICLGAQLLAVACGGTSRSMPPLVASPGSWTCDGGRRPPPTARRRAPDPFPGPSMHADARVSCRRGTWLGGTDMYPHQAFRVGAAAWGVQFHPEVSAPTFRAWAEELPRGRHATRSRAGAGRRR